MGIGGGVKQIKGTVLNQDHLLHNFILTVVKLLQQLLGQRGMENKHFLRSKGSFRTEVGL